ESQHRQDVTVDVKIEPSAAPAVELPSDLEPGLRCQVGEQETRDRAAPAVTVLRVAATSLPRMVNHPHASGFEHPRKLAKIRGDVNGCDVHEDVERPHRVDGVIRHPGQITSVA